MADYVIKEYHIGDGDSDSEDSFDDDDYRFKDKKRAYQDEDLFDYNKDLFADAINSVVKPRM